MFYPFNAARAQTHSNEATRNRMDENEVLTDAYISIAHVYIERACQRGYCRTVIYSPYSIRDEVVERLARAGFQVEPYPNMPNKYIVSWE